MIETFEGCMSEVLRSSKLFQWMNCNFVAVVDEMNPNVIIVSSVVDPLHFGMDPDSRIRATDLLTYLDPTVLFSSVVDKMPTKKICFFLFFLFTTFWRYISSVFTDKSLKEVQNKISYFFACWWKDPYPYKIVTYLDPQQWFQLWLCTCLSFNPRIFRRSEFHG